MRPGRLPRSLAPIINAHSRKGKRGRGGGAKAREVVGGKEGDGGGRRPVGPETFFSCRGQALSACKVQRVGLGEPLHLVLDPRVPSSSPFSFFYLCIPPLLSFSFSLLTLFFFVSLSLSLSLSPRQRPIGHGARPIALDHAIQSRYGHAFFALFNE